MKINKMLTGASRFKIFLLSTALFTLIMSAHYISHAEYLINESQAEIQYGDPEPPPAPDTPEAPGPGEIEDPALSGETVLGVPDPALGEESVVSEPDPVVEQGEPLVEQPEPLVPREEPLGDREAEGRGIR